MKYWGNVLGIGENEYVTSCNVLDKEGIHSLQLSYYRYEDDEMCEVKILRNFSLPYCCS